MFGKNKLHSIYRGIIMTVSKVETDENGRRKTICKEGTERLVLLKKDELYNSYHDLFNKNTYYDVDDLSLNVGDNALVFVSKERMFRSKYELEALKRFLMDINIELEKEKSNGTYDVKELCKKLKIY